ncbi:MAG: Ger(x)C family spore germination protein [Bacillota bacterium]
MIKRFFTKKFFYILCSLLIFLQTGCGDVKEMQKVYYVSAIGVDYQDDQYHAYVQMVTFGAPGTKAEPKTWVSETTGKNFDDALSGVYNSAQNRILWGHVNALLVSEDALKNGFQDVMDAIFRYYEFRLSPWVFGTKEPVDKILSTQSLLNQSAIETLLHEPRGAFQQNSKIRPITLQEFTRELYEPSKTTYIPSLSVNESHWKENQKNVPILENDGAFFLKNNHYKGFYTSVELKGLRWITPETERAGISVPSENQTDFKVVFDEIEAKVKVADFNQDEDSPRFSVHLNAKGNITNRIENEILSYDKMEKYTEESIASEIEKLYHLGLKNDTDFLGLEHILFRKHNRKWRNTLDNESKVLTEVSLKDIIIDVTIEYTGALQNQTLKMESID